MQRLDPFGAVRNTAPPRGKRRHPVEEARVSCTQMKLPDAPTPPASTVMLEVPRRAPVEGPVVV